MLDFEVVLAFIYYRNIVMYGTSQYITFTFPIPVAVFCTYPFALMYTTEAVPKKILELMNVPGLTRENVASHLQVL